MPRPYKKPELQLPTHDGRIFQWDRNTRTGTCELSQFIGKQMFSPLYRDAADVGCYIFSPRTGTYKPFILLCTQYDEELTDNAGEILCWEFESMDDGGRFTVKIFND